MKRGVRANSHLHFVNWLKYLPKFKRSQITVFIIIAVLVVGTAGLVFYTINKNKGTSKLSSDLDKPGLDSLKNSVVDCMEKSSRDSLQKIGIQGGYYKKPERYLDLSWTFVPYYFYEDSLFLPEKTKIESELSNAVDENFLSCLKNIEISDFELNYKTSKTKSIISKGEVKFIIDLPVSVKKGEETMLVQLNTLPIIINSSLYEIYEVAKYIADSNKIDDRYICITCIANMAEERDLYVNMINLPDLSTMYIISENHTSNEPYSFEFLSKYKYKELDNVPMKLLPGGGKENA